MIYGFIVYIRNRSNIVFYILVILIQTIEWYLCPKTSYKIRCCKICRRAICRVLLRSKCFIIYWLYTSSNYSL
nr:MAG TPA: hypothetical protein [Caudoviricetes sp.]